MFVDFVVVVVFVVAVAAAAVGTVYIDLSWKCRAVSEVFALFFMIVF